jgi:hypothetical protein
MVRIVIGAVAAMVLATGAGAQAAAPADEAAAMRDFFTGTLEIDLPAVAWSTKRYFAPDHTYRETGSDGDARGTWLIEDGKVCVMPEKQLPDRAPRYCSLGPGKTVGDKWSAADPVTGNLVLFDLEAGR